ncbi:phage portal protein [Nocardioides sp.]|uniref:phage portal protein n=1 Tax=Nocardioides sp. TaxID=35761 RepID=UPI00356B3462
MSQPLSLVSRNADPYLRLVEQLSRQLDTANVEYDKWDRYYSGDQPLAFLAPEVAAQTGNRLSPMVINWGETIADSVNRRVKHEGFRIGQGRETDAELWRIWTANGMHEDAPLGQVDTLVHGLGFISVWGNDEDPQTPLMTFESAHQVAVIYEPGTGDRVVRAALKRWKDDDGRTFATLYLADRVIRYVSKSDVAGVGSNYVVEQVLNNPLGAVPIVPMVNRGRLLNRAGRSELASIAPIADGINKLATDMMVTSEFFQTPRRWATGIQIPTDGADRERLQAEASAYWENATKSKTWLAGQGVNFGQFPEAELAGFVAGINLLTSALASIGGLPPDDLGLNQVNPASAEARRAAETVLILRADEKKDAWGPRYCRAMRFAVAARDGVPVRAIPQDLSLMTAAFKDSATPAIAQAMDAAVKGVESGVYDIEAAQEVVGLGPTERDAIKARAAEAAAARATADVEARMKLARSLMASDGLTLNAAMAAAGLLAAASTNSAESASTPPVA